MKHTKAWLAGLALLALALTGCATASTPPDLEAVHYSGGAISAKKFKDCLDPSTRSGFDPGDKYIGYPVRQVSYDATGGSDSEAAPFKVVSKDNAEMTVPATITFRLKADCPTLRKMHETIGARYDAGFDASGSSSDTNEGWVAMLNYVIGKPLDTALDRMAQQYKWRDLWNDPKVKTALERQVNASIQGLVTRQAGGDFFTDFSVLIQKPDPVAEGLKQAVALEQTQVAKANAAKARAEADKAAAEAQVAVARARAETKQADINGYRLPGLSPKDALDGYLRSQMVKRGLNPEQPTYLVNGTNQ